MNNKDESLIINLDPIERVIMAPFKGREILSGKIAKYLRSLFLCPRCTFRLLKITEIKFYREDIDVQ